jgi:hypothetical protein
MVNLFLSGPLSLLEFFSCHIMAEFSILSHLDAVGAASESGDSIQTFLAHA